MKPHPKYKPSGIDWIGEIPSHWNINKFNRVSYMKGRIGWQGLKHAEFTMNQDDPFLITGMNFKDGKIRWDEVYHFAENRYNEAPEIQLKQFDVLMTKDGTIGKLLFVDSLPGKASLNSHLLVFRPLNKEYFPKYLYYQLQSQPFLHFIELNKTGTTFYGLTQEATGSYKIILPAFEEQATIANYLDEKTAQIDKLIDKKYKLIELLKEERTAIINEAVSGEGKNWERKKLKYVVSKVGSGITPSGGASVYLQEGIPLLRSQNIYNDGLRLEDVAYISEEIDEEMSNSRVNEGDVLLNITGASIGRCYFIPENFGRGNVNQHVCILRPIQSEIKTKYFHAFLVSDFGQTLINICQNGANREGLNFQQIKSFEIPLPGIAEQNQIVKNIQTETKKIDNTIAKIKKEIELMQEYRTALISEVVTGKIQVA